MAERDTQPLEEEREMGKEMGGETGGEAQLKEEEEEEEEQEEGEEESAPFKPFVLPGEQWMKADITQRQNGVLVAQAIHIVMLFRKKSLHWLYINI